MLSLVTGRGDPQEPRVTRPATYGGNGGELTLLLYLVSHIQCTRKVHSSFTSYLFRKTKVSQRSGVDEMMSRVLWFWCRKCGGTQLTGAVGGFNQNCRIAMRFLQSAGYCSGQTLLSPPARPDYSAAGLYTDHSYCDLSY